MKQIAMILLILAGAFGQSATVPAFEVASIRPHIFPKGTFGFGSGSVKVNGNRVTATQVTLQGLLMYGYGVKDYQIIGTAARDAPWSDSFDIAATTNDDTPGENQVQQMVQALLVDRFQLKLHREMRDLPVYDLIVGKNGPKFKESSPDAKSSVTVTVAPGPSFRMVFSNKPISELARVLTMNQGVTDRAVVDKTGLKAGYDFTLEFSRGAAANGDTADPTGTSIYTAVQEQLGLKLDPVKEPVEALVIDHVEKGPSAN
jgi:uncharacterized protein (TIGR03435 family)